MYNANILIVEDNQLAASGLKSLLIQFGFKINDIVSSYGGVLESIKAKEPDIILMDIDLGNGVSGIDISEKIKEKYNIPVLFITSFSDIDTMERAFDTKPVGYIIKPYREEEVKTTIMLAMYKIKKLEYSSINEDNTSIGFDFYFDMKNQKLYYKSKLIKITKKEKTLIYYLTKSKGISLNTENLERHVWTDKAPSESSLRTLIYRLNSKLGEKLITSTYSEGYKIV